MRDARDSAPSLLNTKSLIKFSWRINELLVDYFSIDYGFFLKISLEWIKTKRYHVYYNQKNTYEKGSIRMFYFNKLFQHFTPIYTMVTMKVTKHKRVWRGIMFTFWVCRSNLMLGIIYSYPIKTFNILLQNKQVLIVIIKILALQWYRACVIMMVLTQF